MTDDQHQPRTADEIPEWELEEMIREATVRASATTLPSWLGSTSAFNEALKF
jgi:hypothetical protein